MTSNDTGDNKAVLSLRHFLTNGLGSRIITMMSSEDLDLSVSQQQLIVLIEGFNLKLLIYLFVISERDERKGACQCADENLPF